MYKNRRNTIFRSIQIKKYEKPVLKALSNGGGTGYIDNEKGKYFSTVDQVSKIYGVL